MYIITDYLYSFLLFISSYSSPMGTNSSLPSLAPLGALSSYGIHTTLSIDGCADVNHMKIANPPDYSVPPLVVVHTPHPWTQSLQSDVPTLKEDKSPLKSHSYLRVVVIKPNTYFRSLLRSAKGHRLDCRGCTVVHSIGIDHCHKHDSDKNGKRSHERLRR